MVKFEHLNGIKYSNLIIALKLKIAFAKTLIKMYHFDLFYSNFTIRITFLHGVNNFCSFV